MARYPLDGSIVRQVPSRSIFILMPNFIPIFIIHNVVNGGGLWQIQNLNTYFWEDSGADTVEMLSHTISSAMPSFSSVQVIDSHTAGEPTRVVIEGGPDLGSGSLTERLACFRERYDFFRSGVENVPAYRLHKDVSLDVPGYGVVTGDVAWGGNWFFLASIPGLSLALANVAELSKCAQAIKTALAGNGITGTNGDEIDHIELFGAAEATEANSRNFVLCPGNAYDRSPCGTGTSAKMACLYADGHLSPGKVWRQEGILGTYFDGSVSVKDGQVIPSITGEAYVTKEAKLFFAEKDPFRWEI